ncbi:hypothetical protein ANN_08702 [Periplaneta americana]|uniref:Uncharacterized protein n=1 Tax=Periplaneta americana TaxID=6978 RepID=A0ABQ8T3R1_PERAM|nr:hypothetical protein ANN_08702 [Periplaneta americana]
MLPTSNHVRVPSSNLFQRSSKYNIKNDENSVAEAIIGSTERVPTVLCCLGVGTCLAQRSTAGPQQLDELTEEIRAMFSGVDTFISAMKKIFLKALQGYNNFDIAPGIALPPKAVITRWGTWVEAVSYYAVNYTSVIKAVFFAWFVYVGSQHRHWAYSCITSVHTQPDDKPHKSLIFNDNVMSVGSWGGKALWKERNGSNITQDNNRSEVETLAHVLGSYPFGETLCNNRHHKIRFVIATCLKSNGYTTFKEVHGIANTGSLRRIDIVTFKPGETKDYILDPTIRFETHQNQPEEVNLEKRAIYEPTIPFYKTSDGFRSGYSCESQITSLIQDLSDEVDRGEE